MAMASDSIRRARALLGTFVEITAAGAPRRELEIAVEAAFDAVAEVHRLMSFHDPASDVSRLNVAAGRLVPVAPWTFEVIEIALDLQRRSDGLFDVAVAPVLQDLGLLPRLGAPRAPARRVAQGEAIELMPDRRVRLSADMRIDLGGIAKGFAVDRAVEALRARGVTSGLVNAGGDLAAFGPTPHAVHLRDPRDPRDSLGSVMIVNEALASTGARFDPFASTQSTAPAVIDPRTQTPVPSIKGVAVRGPSCVLADALTKIVAIAGEGASALLDRLQASALLVRQDGEVVVSPAWQADRAA
jgi:thiamine biosynthesis lipoprotein